MAGVGAAGTMVVKVMEMTMEAVAVGWVILATRWAV